MSGRLNNTSDSEESRSGYLELSSDLLHLKAYKKYTVDQDVALLQILFDKQHMSNSLKIKIYQEILRFLASQRKNCNVHAPKIPVSYFAAIFIYFYESDTAFIL